MPSFFNANPESPDLQLLPASVRKDEDLVAIAAECEAAVLAQFTGLIHQATQYGDAAAFPVVGLVPTGAYALDATNGLYVFLRGYDPVRASCPEPLATALVREIAGVIRWRRTQWRDNPQTAAESDGDGGASKSFREDKNARFPQDFGAYLRPYDIRPAPAAI